MQFERSRDEEKIKIHQSAYTQKVLERFNQAQSSPVSTPADPSIKFTKENESLKEGNNFLYREAIGSLMYLTISTRPDLS